MAGLTQQDRENYKKLQIAVKNLWNLIKDLAENPIQKLLKSLSNELLQESKFPETLNTLEELESRLNMIDAYLGPQNLLLASPTPAIAEATQELLQQSDLIKESLQDLKGTDLSRLDDLESSCTDPQFFELIKGNPKKPNIEASWTKSLLADHPLNLNNTQIDQLTNVWGIAIAGIVDDAQKQRGKLVPGTTDTISRFFCIHEELEALYDRVSNLVA